MPSDRYLFVPFLRTKSQMGETKNWSNRQLPPKDHRTNIIPKNFVCEQLKRYRYRIKQNEKSAE